MLNYIGFGLSVFMLMVSLTVGSWWAAGWLVLVWLNASSVADRVQIREILAELPPETVAELTAARAEGQGGAAMSITGVIQGKRYRITQRVEKAENHFHAVYKGRDIQIDREGDGSFYIIVTHIESGMHDYDGWWRESQYSTKTIDEAIEEALKGAMLV